MDQYQSDHKTDSVTSFRQVFLIGADSGDVALVRRAISHVGYAIHLEVLQTAEALKETINQGTDSCPDLILIDLQLYNCDRTSEDVFGLARWLRRQGETLHTPIVMISARNEEDTLLRSYEAGASSVIAKPAAFTEYAAVLKEVCRYWLNLSIRPHCKYTRQPPTRQRARVIS